MSEHTQGKIHASILPHTDEWELIGNDYIRPDYLQVPLIAGGLKGEDARRLAAAWNNAEGMDTQEIEQGMPLIKARDTINAQARSLAASIDRIAKLESLVTERDAMLGKRPCQNSRCNELNASRALLREIYQDGNMDIGDQVSKELDARLGSYLDACDTLEGK